MSTDISKSSVLLSYSSNIEKANNAFSFGRGLMDRWSGTKISFLAMTLQPYDFYKYLVEIGFISTEFVNCNICKG